MSPIRKPSGFTMLEMMIVVVIIGILAGVAVPSFVASISGNKINSDGRDFTDGCRLARARAVSENRTYLVTRGSNRAWSVSYTDDDGNPVVVSNDSTNASVWFRDDGGMYGEIGDIFNFQVGSSIEFYSNGSCNGTDVVMENDNGKQIMIDCSVATGRVLLRTHT